MTISRLAGTLKARATSWAGQLTSLAKSLAPTHVANAISSHVEDKGEGEYIIRITANRNIAPDARAWEFGSGIHARRGVKKKYPIKPKEKKILAFYWDVATVSEMERGSPGKFMFAPDGRVLFHSVQHPGIEAANGGKGYIAPAMIELRKKGRQELSESIRQAIVGDLRESFGRKSR
jgi:hypothetical protein